MTIAITILHLVPQDIADFPSTDCTIQLYLLTYYKYDTKRRKHAPLVRFMQPCLLLKTKNLVLDPK